MMAEAHLDRLLPLLSSDDEALVLQGIELMRSLGDPQLFARVLIGARLDGSGQLTPAESLSTLTTICLLAHAPETARLSRELQRPSIRRLSLSMERIPDSVERFAHLEHLEATHRSAAPLPASLSRQRAPAPTAAAPAIIAGTNSA